MREGELGSTADEAGTHTTLEKLAKDNISINSTKRLEYVLQTLSDAEELNEPLCWDSEIWEGCTVEELLGGLIEAEQLMER